MLVPGAAVCVEAFDDREQTALFPEEEALIRAAVPARREEFSTARRCAHRALEQLGISRRPLLPDHRGAPVWPDGVAGSITHCTAYRAAVVARTADLASLGIDAEPAHPLPDGVLAAISLPGERSRVRDLAARAPQIAWERLLFSAKEAVYKASYPLLGQALDFTDAEVALGADGRFGARLLVAGGPAFEGKWTTGAGLVITAVTVPAVRAGAPAAAWSHHAA